MAAMPELAPSGESHVLSSTSVIQHVFYKGQTGKYVRQLHNMANIEIYYSTYDEQGTELIRLAEKPSRILFDDQAAVERDLQEGYTWKPLAKGGILTIRRMNDKSVTVVK